MEAIKKLSRNDHIICIDDMREIKKKKPWGENNYDDFYNEMTNMLKKINNNYKINFIQGLIERDLLLAYV